MKPSFDQYDQTILNERIEARHVLGNAGPLVGDYVEFPDGHSERISHDWIDSLQTSHDGSFYLCPNGDASFSGSLNSAIKLEYFQPTDELRNGSFWFFHHDHWKASNGVYFKIPCRVYHCTINR